MIVIDKKGNEVDVEPVDAREYVASGEYSYPNTEKPKKQKAVKKAIVDSVDTAEK